MHPGPILIEVYLEVREGFIVFESDIIPGAMPFYQVALKD
ncbi:unnamed protein product, partial [marine sediment metagenome]